MDTLSDVELVALGGAVKDKALTAAKARLADGSAHQVDFTVRINGSVQKGTRTADATVEVTPTVNLRTPAHFCAVLRALGIGAKRFAAALVALQAVTPDAELEELIAAEEARRAAKLPRTVQTTPGRAGTVQTQVTALKAVLPKARKSA